MATDQQQTQRTERRKVEYKHLESNAKKAFDKNTQEEAKQADPLVFVIKGEYDEETLKDAIAGRARKHKNIKTIRFIFYYERDIEITRSQIINKEYSLK
nr:hypothetical protein [uncultured Porphyromonas sp.]